MVAGFLIVSIHDVEPATVSAVEELLDSVAPRVGRIVSLAVIPRLTTSTSERECVSRAIGCADEVLMHGVTHRRAWSMDPFSLLIGRNDEFAGLNEEATIARLKEGVRRLRVLYGVRVLGTLPPAWRGRHVVDALRAADLRFAVMHRRLFRSNGDSMPLATRSWDPGPIGCLWPIAECLGRWPIAPRGATVCVTLHPADVRRGLLPRAIRHIDRLLHEGWHPITFEGLIRFASNGGRAL
jgi:hypothetical protein